MIFFSILRILRLSTEKSQFWCHFQPKNRQNRGLLGYKTRIKFASILKKILMKISGKSEPILSQIRPIFRHQFGAFLKTKRRKMDKIREVTDLFRVIFWELFTHFSHENRTQERLFIAKNFELRPSYYIFADWIFI